MTLPVMSGQLLVASPTLDQQPFTRSVVLILEHQVDGTVGIILNRPTDIPLEKHFVRWSDMAVPPAVVFHGGPVQPDTALAIGSAPVGTPGLQAVDDHFGVVDLAATPDPFERVRVYAGYSGWGSSQLADEIANGDWLVIEPTHSDIFSNSPHELWRTTLRRQAGIRRLLASYPDDVSLN